LASRGLARLESGPPETEFQLGLRKLSTLLVTVADILTGAIFVTNVAPHSAVPDASCSSPWRSQ